MITFLDYFPLIFFFSKMTYFKEKNREITVLISVQLKWLWAANGTSTVLRDSVRETDSHMWMLRKSLWESICDSHQIYCPLFWFLVFKVVCSHCILIPQGSIGSTFFFVSNENPYFFFHYNSKISASNSLYYDSYSRKCTYSWYTNFDFLTYFHNSLIFSVTFLFLLQDIIEQATLW